MKKGWRVVWRGGAWVAEARWMRGEYWEVEVDWGKEGDGYWERIFDQYWEE